MPLKFQKYLLGGAISTGFDITIFNFLVYFLNINYLISNFISFVSAVLIAFFFHRYITFANIVNNNIKYQFVLFALVALSSLIFNSLLLYIFVTYALLNPFIAKFIQVVLMIKYNYKIHNKYIFKLKSP